MSEESEEVKKQRSAERWREFCLDGASQLDGGGSCSYHHRIVSACSVQPTTVPNCRLRLSRGSLAGLKMATPIWLDTGAIEAIRSDKYRVDVVLQKSGAGELPIYLPGRWRRWVELSNIATHLSRASLYRRPNQFARMIDPTSVLPRDGLAGSNSYP